MEGMLQDIRYGARILMRNPGFATVALLTLALGICANATIFTFVNAALVRPLPYLDASQLVEIFDTRKMEVSQRFESSYPDYLDWRQKQSVFVSMAGFNGPRRTIFTGSGVAEPLTAAAVSDTFFRTLGVAPAIGRDFREGEDLATAPRTVILSYGVWQRRFGRREHVIGQTMALDGEATVIIGVLPPSFHFAPMGEPELWLTLHADGGMKDRRNNHWLNVIARLKPGVTREQAGEAMKAIARGLEEVYPVSNRDLRTAVLPLASVIVGDVKPVLVVLVAAVGMLLLIVCVNVANLLMARSAARGREMATRAALGAGRMRLARQMVTEGLVLVALGGALGLLAARWAVAVLLHVLPRTILTSMPYLRSTNVDWNVMAFSAGVSLLTGLLFALAPALQLSRHSSYEPLKQGRRGGTDATWRRFASALVVAEMAMAVMLLVAAGLLIKSVYKLLRVETGFRAEHAVLVRVVPSVSPLAKPEARDAQLVAMHKRLMARVRALPGVESAGTSNILPVSDGGNTILFRVIGQPVVGEGSEANLRQVSPGYFPALQVHLVAGRWFTDADDSSMPHGVIVNETFVSRYLPRSPAVGQHIVFSLSATQKPREIIGVVKDVREGPLDAPIHPAVYTPEYESPEQSWGLVVRGSLAPAALLAEVEKALRDEEPEAAVFNGRPLQDLIDDSPAAYLHRYPSWLVAGFALMALLLAAMGLYGVIAYSVSQRTREIGIRMALGARPSQVLRMIVSEGGRLVAFGILAGNAGAIVLASLIRSFLFEVRAWDAGTLAGVTVTLAAVALLASYIPARRAVRVDPVVAVQYE